MNAIKNKLRWILLRYLLKKEACQYTQSRFVSAPTLAHSILMPSDIYKRERDDMFRCIGEAMMKDGYLEFERTESSAKDGMHLRMRVFVFKGR